jgi:hypothetical protein
VRQETVSGALAALYCRDEAAVYGMQGSRAVSFFTQSPDRLRRRLDQIDRELADINAFGLCAEPGPNPTGRVISQCTDEYRKKRLLVEQADLLKELL